MRGDNIACKIFLKIDFSMPINSINKTKKIGEHLIEKGQIKENDILQALERQLKTKAKLGEILLADGKLSAFKFYRELADLKKMPFIDLDKYSINLDIIEEELQAEYIEKQYVPFDQADGRLMIATSDADEKQDEYLRNKFGDCDIFLTSPYDILWTLQKRFSQKDSLEAAEMVSKNLPNFSSKKSFFSGFNGVISAIIFAAFLFSLQYKIVFYSFIFLVNIFFLSVIASKFYFIYKGYKFEKTHSEIEEKNFSEYKNNSEYFPVYSILVPLFKEKELTINQLIKGIKKIDYPQEKLDVKLIVEIDDIETIEVIKSLKPSANFQIIRVPHSLPKTKPKACNYALKYCKGEFVTIYDAEDQPDIYQIKKALMNLEKNNGKLASIQARLNFYNKDENLLTSLFAMEYATWFEYLLYGLKSLGLPIPLGGTSNHFPTNTLKTLYAWDAYNVTEDADLGVRIAVSGLETNLINSTTYEEAPITLNNWIKQRTRWLKGHLQTFLVNIKNYKVLQKNIGNKGIFGLFYFIAAPFLVYLLIPFTILTSLISLTFSDGLPDSLIDFCLFNLYFGVLIHFALGVFIIAKNKWWSNIISTLYFPFYWALHCLTSYFALIELIRKPHHWNKTEHGLSSLTPDILK
ncbi:MAG: glycosyltransferase [Rickettsiales bacterium]|nr:glycosyltransferase [Rickettsiales bacterium]